MDGEPIAERTFPHQPEQISVSKHEYIPSELRKEFQKAEPEIKALYEQVAGWHGTGRYQYRDDEVIDVLAGIVTDHAIKPHIDIADFKKGVDNTISMTPYRMYADLYAQMHLTDNEDLEYSYLTRGEWHKYIRKRSFPSLADFAAYSNYGTRKFLEGKVGLQTISMIKQWATNTRKWHSKIRKVPSSEYPDRTSTIRSDIPGNYPILIGTKNGAFEPIETARYFKMETRSRTPIDISSFTHFEVPKKHVQETIDYLHSQNISTPVIPLELGEVYSSQFTPEQLMNGNPFREK